MTWRAQYLSVIDGQNHLIESLRLLHEHGENTYVNNEDLVRSLCRYDQNNKLAIPYGEEWRDPWDKYSARDDKFILSPLDGPTALSMKVSLSAPPFQGRHDADLKLDPHWQRFLNSIARKETEQDARHASAVRRLIEEKAETHSGIEDAGVQEYNNTSRIDDGGYHNGEEIEEKMDIKDSSEQTHHDASQIDDGREDGDYGNENEIRKAAGVNTASGLMVLVVGFLALDYAIFTYNFAVEPGIGSSSSSLMHRQPTQLFHKGDPDREQYMSQV